MVHHVISILIYFWSEPIASETFYMTREIKTINRPTKKMENAASEQGGSGD
jgi:hypothetical protein